MIEMQIWQKVRQSVSQPDTGLVNTTTNAICLDEQINMDILYLFQTLRGLNMIQENQYTTQTTGHTVYYDRSSFQYNEW